MCTKGKKNNADAKGHKDIAIYCNRPKLELIDSRNRLLKPKVTYSINQ